MIDVYADTVYSKSPAPTTVIAAKKGKQKSFSSGINDCRIRPESVTLGNITLHYTDLSKFLLQILRW